MAETAQEHPVLVHFRQKDPKTGRSQTYDPNGDDVNNGGWPGAKSVWTGVPGSDEAQHLLAGADSHHGPLIGEPVKKTSSASAKSAADSKEG